MHAPPIVAKPIGLEPPASTGARHHAGRILRETPRSAAFLVSSFFWGGFVFVALVALLTFGAGLAITWIGIPILALAVVAWMAAARIERWRIRKLLRIDIPTPYQRRPTGSLLSRARALLSDPAVWRDLAYGLFLFPIATVEFAVAVAAVLLPLWFVAMPIVVGAGVDSTEFGAWRIDQMSEALFICVIGFLILIPCLAIAVGMARAHGHVAYALLGPSRTELLEHRVGTLTRSRADVMDAMLIERRRIERDLHDGVQQQLVSLAMNLGMAKEKLAPVTLAGGDPPAEGAPGPGAATDVDAARRLVDTSHDEVKLVLKELRELVQGIYPAVLSDRGLDAALSAAAGRCPVPVTLTTRLDRRLAEGAEATAYFVATEALTNVAKHSGATQAWLDVAVEGDLLTIDVRDNGRGMPDRTESRGLEGLRDRVAALDGQLIVQSPTTGGTIVRALIPCGSDAAGQP